MAIIETTQAASASGVRVSSYALFTAFSRIALSGFGGVLPFAYRGLVEKREWLSATEFAEFRAFSQIISPRRNLISDTCRYTNPLFQYRLC